MIDKTPISNDAREVCKLHFDPRTINCRCPISTACNSGPIGVALTYENLEAWRLRLNAAAAAERKSQ